MSKQRMDKAPSLVELCIWTAIDNVRYIGDVGETDIEFLGRILPHCTIDQLRHVEDRTKGRDLSPVTDALWKNFYRKEFGEKSYNSVLDNMRENNVTFQWRRLFEAKKNAREQEEEDSRTRLKQLYKKEDAKKQSKQIQICTKVPPSSKRSFFGGSGPGYNFSSTKSNLMKKSKIDFMKSHEMKNLVAMRRNAVQRTISPPTKTTPSSSRPVSHHSQETENPAEFRKNASRRTLMAPPGKKPSGFLMNNTASSSTPRGRF